MQAVDIAIIGAGATGLVCAHRLAKETPFTILLLEKQTMGCQPMTVKTHYRALNRYSQTILENLGVWQTLEAVPVRQMHLWHTKPHALHLTPQQARQTILAHIIDMTTLISALRMQSRVYARLQYQPYHAPLILRQGYGTHCLGVDNQFYQAQLVIGAEGAHSLVRTYAGLSFVGKSYFEKALVCTIQTEKPHHNTAYQRFLMPGTLAFLPLAHPNQFSIVWADTEAKIEQALREPLATLENSLTTQSEQRVGRVRCLTSPIAFPLSQKHATHYVKDGIALIGDAAHQVHPLAGMGLNLGLADSVALASVLKTAAQTHTRPGALSTLLRYERMQKGLNGLYSQLFDGIHAYFSRSGAHFFNHPAVFAAIQNCLLLKKMLLLFA